MSSPDLWVVASLRWLLLCGASATKLEAGTLAVTAVLTLLTPPRPPIRPLAHQDTTSQR